MTTAHSEGRSYEFGLKDRLRAAREMTGMSQSDFAKETGIGRATIVNYETGKTPPKRPNIAAWAMATGFSTLWLETGELPQNRDTQTTHEYQRFRSQSVVRQKEPNRNTGSRRISVLAA